MPLKRYNAGPVGESAEGRALKRLENELGRTPVFGAHKSVSAAYTIVDSDWLILCDTTSAGFTVTLPPEASNMGRVFVVKKVSADGNTLTIDGVGTIDGAGTLAFTTAQRAVQLYCTGAVWMVVSTT